MTVTAEVPAAFRRRGGIPGAYGWDDLGSVIELVGPHGYIHGWIFVGIPGAGQKVTLSAGHHATGTVEGADATHVHVRMADGSLAHIPHNGGTGAGKLAKVPTATPQYASTREGRDQVSKALLAARGAAPGKASSPMAKRTQTELLARAVSRNPPMASDEVLSEHVAGMRASLNAGDSASFQAHRDAAEARVRQHGMMPAGDIKDTGRGDMGAPPAPKAKHATGNDRQLSLLGERMTGPDKTSGLMKAGDMQEGYQAIGQAPAGIAGGSDPWWMAGPGGTFALSVRGSSGNRQIIPWSSEKQQETESRAMQATRTSADYRGNYFGYGSQAQQAMARTAVARSAHLDRQAAGQRKDVPAAVKAPAPKAPAVRPAAQGTQAGTRDPDGSIRTAGSDLKPGDRIASIAGGFIASTSREPGGTRVTLRNGGVAHLPDGETLPVHPTVKPQQAASGAQAADRMTAAATTVARVKAASSMTDDELAQANRELSRRAASLGKAGQLSKGQQEVQAEMKRRGIAMSVTWDDLGSVIDLAVRSPVKTPAVKAPARPAGKPAGTPPVPPPSSRRSRITPLTPMRVQAAKSMSKLADSMRETHPDMLSHQHVRDAARMLRAGNEEAAQRHLRAAMFSLTPQSLMRHGLHTDDAHMAARQAMHGAHRHLLLVKDIADVAAKNQASIAKASYGDNLSAPPHPDPNNGYGPGALAQKPTARQPPGDQALNAPNRSSSGGSDPNVADPVGPQRPGSKQFSYGWDDLSRVIELTTGPKVVVDLVGPKGYIHGWIYVDDVPGLPSVAEHNAKLRAKGVTPPTKAHPALTSKPPSVKAPAKAVAPPKAAPKPPARVAVPAKSAPAPPVAAVKPGAPAPKPDPNAERLVNTLNLMASLGGKSAQAATAKNISTSDLHAVDAEYRRQDLAKGRVAAGHKIVQEALANRGETTLPTPTADDLAKGKVAAKVEAARPRTPQEERQDMIGAWSTSYRYRGTTESKNPRTRAFATEMHRLLSTNKQPKTCGPGCQDAHKFLTMVDKESVPQDKELTRGVTLSSSAAERMFKPGKKVDMPVASWTNDDHTAANYARPGKDGQVTVMLHAASGAKGLDITKDSNWENENEVVSGGRFNVDKVQTQNGVMHVYLTQGDFSAH